MINLNTATAEELDGIEGLRGHGFEIVRYREERGRFTSLRELDDRRRRSAHFSRDWLTALRARS